VIDPEPICATCYAPMRIVPVYHPGRRSTFHPFCETCLTCRHLDLADLPMPEPVVDRGRHLRAVR